MALRLAGAVTPVAGPIVTDESTVAALLGGGAAALSRQDLAAYQATFERLEEIEDPQRRYATAVRLLELGLRGATSVSDRIAIRSYAAVADAGLTLLAQTPAEPILLNYTAVACYELWALEAARTLFDAAARLDPELPHLQANRTELGRRRARPTGRPVHPSVPGLVGRAAGVARQARPTPGLTLSLCMIVKDEEQMLGRCLEAAAPAVDEIVVVDTGSRDATIEIARSFGARVIERPWTGSFADARNVSFDAASSDWLIYLDADEVLVTEDAERLRALTGHTWREAFHFIETSFTGELDQGTSVVNSAMRMFRNRPEYRFEGAIHEQIAHRLPEAPGRIEHTSVRIEHYGYLGDVRTAKDKSTRNLTLLREQLRTTSSPSPFLRFNLGCEHAAIGDYAVATQELTLAWEQLERDGELRVPPYVPTLASTMVRALRSAGRSEEAIEWARRGLAEFDDFTDLVLEWANAAADLGDLETATERLEHCLELGDAPAQYGGLVGAGSHLPRLALARLALQEHRPGDAVALLQWCAEHRPGFHAIVGPYAAARLQTGANATEVVDELQARLEPLPPIARLALARALRAAAATDAASDQLRQVIASDDPRTAGEARCSLAELLLDSGAFAEAAPVASGVTDDDPHSRAACRIEMVARICGDDLSGAHRVLDRAERAGVSRAEHTVLEAWLASAGGAPPAEGLPVSGAPLLATLLELMLRLRQATQATHLAALLARSRLAPREQAELVAGIHLRTGNLAAAAELWLAVCRREPDARARLGLARVAAAQGMREDAAVFCAAALELDPLCEAARALLATLQTSREPALDI